MALNFKTYERTERTSLGTVAQLVGQKGNYRLASTANWLSDKRVVLVLTKEDGTSDTVTCSATVSERLRSKELRLSQLQHFEVIEQLTNGGGVMNVVVMPSVSNTLPSVEVGKVEAPAYQPVATFNLDELVAF